MNPDVPVQWTDYDRKGRPVAVYRLTFAEGERLRCTKTPVLHMNYGGFWGPGSSLLTFADGHQESPADYVARVKKEGLATP